MLKRKIEELVKLASPVRHSCFQLEYFVIGKEPTMQGKLRQCLIELEARRDSLENIEMEIEEMHDLKLLLEIEKEETLNSSLSKAKTEIKIRMTDRKIKSNEKRSEELKIKKLSFETEAKFLIELFEYLTSVEPLKEWDSPDVQLEYWTEKARYELNAKAAIKQMPDAELVKHIMSLPDVSEVKRHLIKMINQKKPALTES